MKPPLRYAKTVDGGRVAFTDVGEGYPYVDFMGGPDCNAVLAWSTPGFSEYYVALASRFRFVRAEPRGAPNSDPPPASRKYRDYILEDINSVLDALSIETCVLTAGGVYSQHLADYAVTRPQRVSHLVFWQPIIEPGVFRGTDWSQYNRVQEERATWAGVDPFIMAARTVLPYAEAAHAESYARILRSNSGPKYERWFELAMQRNGELDLTDTLCGINQPTLVCASPAAMEAARTLTMAISKASLVTIAGPPTHTTDNAEHALTIEFLERFVYGSECGRGSTAAARNIGDGSERLTTRESEILRLLASGRSNAEIGESLVLSSGTVRRHVANIYGKLGIHNRAQATAVYFGVASDGRS